MSEQPGHNRRISHTSPFHGAKPKSQMQELIEREEQMKRDAIAQRMAETDDIAEQLVRGGGGGTSERGSFNDRSSTFSPYRQKPRSEIDEKMRHQAAIAESNGSSADDGRYFNDRSSTFSPYRGAKQKSQAEEWIARQERMQEEEAPMAAMAGLAMGDNDCDDDDDDDDDRRNAPRSSTFSPYRQKPRSEMDEKMRQQREREMAATMISEDAVGDIATSRLAVLGDEFDPDEGASQRLMVAENRPGSMFSPYRGQKVRSQFSDQSLESLSIGSASSSSSTSTSTQGAGPVRRGSTMAKNCSVANCPNRRDKNGYCIAHWKSLQQGDVTTATTTTSSSSSNGSGSSSGGGSATSTTTTAAAGLGSHSGIMWKMSEKISPSGWNKRWFVLDNGVLSYWKSRPKSPSTSSGRTELPLYAGSSVSRETHRDYCCGRQYVLSLIPTFGKRRFLLACDTQEEHDIWFTHIRGCIAGLRRLADERKQATQGDEEFVLH